MNRFTMAATAAALSSAAMVSPPAFAQALADQVHTAEASVVTIVRIPTPWYAPRFLVVRKMRESMPLYSAIDGLTHKAYSLARSDGRFGGIYHWKDLASAQAWFTPAWFERVEKERGARGEVRFFEVSTVIDTQSFAASTGTDLAAMATLLEVPRAAGADRARPVDGFLAAVDTWRAIPGLLRTYVVTTPQGGPGAISLWQDEASARHALQPSWSDRIVREYGEPARIEWLDTPILMAGKDGGNAMAVETRR
jgi:hypothetical protein